MPITLPTADTLFPQTPGLRGGRVASYDLTGIARGQAAEAAGEVARDDAMSQGSNREAQAAAAEGQAERLKGEGALLTGRTEQEDVRTHGAVDLAQAKQDAELGIAGAKVGGENAISMARAYSETEQLKAKSDQVLAKAFSNLSDTAIKLGIEYSDRQRVKLHLDQQTKANSDRLIGVVKQTQAIKDDSESPETMVERNRKLAMDNLNAAAAHFTDPDDQRRYIEEHLPEVERLAVAAGERRDTVVKDTDMAKGKETLATLQKMFVNTDDPAERAKLQGQADEIINNWNTQGHITDEKRFEMSRNWVTESGQAGIAKLTDRQKLGALGGFRGALQGQESGARQGKVNELGFAGLYQFGAPRLQEIGAYTPGADEPRGQAWNRSPKNAPGKWSGEFHIPGFEGVKTLQDFLANKDAQEAAFRMHTVKMDQEIERNGFSKFFGKEVQGVTITRSGLYGGLHISGVGGVSAFLNGRDSPPDANGKRASDYIRQFANAPVGNDLARFIPPDKAAEQFEHARSRVAAEEHNAEVQDVQNKRIAVETLKVQMFDDLEQIKREGLPSDKLNRQTIVTLFGEQVAKQHDQDQYRAGRIFSATSLIPTANQDQLSEILRFMRPELNSSGYGEDVAAYNRVLKQVNDTLTARAQDPATAVQDMPTVVAARNAAKYETDAWNNRKVMTPASTQSVARASLAAQESLQIPRPQLLTKEEAQQLVREFDVAYKEDGKDNGKAMAAFVKRLENQYGPDLAPMAMQNVLESAAISHDAVPIAREIMEGLIPIAKGDHPTPEQIRHAAAAQAAQNTSAAIRGKPTVTGAPPSLGAQELLAAMGDENPSGALEPGVETAAKAASGLKPGQKPTFKDGTSNVSIAPAAVKALLKTGRMTDEQFDERYGKGAADFFRKGYRKIKGRPEPTATPAEKGLEP